MAFVFDCPQNFVDLNEESKNYSQHDDDWFEIDHETENKSRLNDCIENSDMDELRISSVELLTSSTGFTPLSKLTKSAKPHRMIQDYCNDENQLLNIGSTDAEQYQSFEPQKSPRTKLSAKPLRILQDGAEQSTNSTKPGKKVVALVSNESKIATIKEKGTQNIFKKRTLEDIDENKTREKMLHDFKAKKEITKNQKIDPKRPMKQATHSLNVRNPKRNVLEMKNGPLKTVDVIEDEIELQLREHNAKCTAHHRCVDTATRIASSSSTIQMPTSQRRRPDAKHCKGAAAEPHQDEEDGDDDIEALLRQHNIKHKPKSLYEPAKHSVKDTRMWEKATGKLWAQLSATEREQANSAIEQMKLRGTCTAGKGPGR